MIRTVLLTFSMLCYSAVASAALYKWVDEKGNTHYTSTPPPESAVHDREVIGKQGQVIKTLRGQMSPEEKAAYEQKLIEEERAAKEKAEQQEYDRRLMMTYNSLQDLEDSREEKLGAHDEYIESLKETRNRAGQEYDELLNQAILQEREGKVPSEQLKAQMRSAKREFEGAEEGLEKAATEREELVQRFDTELSRFKKLKGIGD
jgi:hypothetical protein